MYVHHPNVAAVGKALFFTCGNVADGSIAIYENGPFTPHITSTMLAAGWHVVVAMLPNYSDEQPLQVAVVNGVTLTQVKNTGYAPKGLDPPYDAPSTLRLFTDQVFVAKNWVLANLHPTTLGLAGHSGGAATCCYVATLDASFQLVRVMNPGWAWFDLRLDQIPFGCVDNEIFQAASGRPYGTFGDLLATAAAVAGRKTLVDTSTLDEYMPNCSAPWAAAVAQVNPWIVNLYGGSVGHRIETADSHDPGVHTGPAVTAWFIANG
jgi:hypothetical protein